MASLPKEASVRNPFAVLLFAVTPASCASGTPGPKPRRAAAGRAPRCISPARADNRQVTRIGRDELVGEQDNARHDIVDHPVRARRRIGQRFAAAVELHHFGSRSGNAERRGKHTVAPHPLFDRERVLRAHERPVILDDQLFTLAARPVRAHEIGDSRRPDFGDHIERGRRFQQVDGIGAEARGVPQAKRRVVGDIVMEIILARRPGLAPEQEDKLFQVTPPYGASPAPDPDRAGFARLGCLCKRRQRAPDQPVLDETRLGEVKVDTWGGFVWINLDPDCEPLRDYLEPAASLLDPFQLQKMRPRWRNWTVFDCNWKVALEAFNETYRVPGTHPEFTAFGDFTGWGRPQGKHSHIAKS